MRTFVTTFGLFYALPLQSDLILNYHHGFAYATECENNNNVPTCQLVGFAYVVSRKALHQGKTSTPRTGHDLDQNDHLDHRPYHGGFASAG